MAENILKKFSSWTISNGGGTTEVTDSLTVTDDGYGCSFTITNESSYVYTELTNIDSIRGHTLKFTATNISATDNEEWIQIRLYNADNSDYTSIDFYNADISLPFNIEFEIPADCGRVRIYVRHQWDSDGIDPPCTITIEGLCLEDTYSESLTALNFHKVLEENLPAQVTPGTQHIYFTTDGTTVKQYIATKEGYLVPVGATSSGNNSGTETEYTNAYTQQYIDERKAEISELTKNGHCIVFAVATDIHVRIEDGDAGRYNQVRDFIMVSNQLPLDYIHCCGDIMSYCQDWDGVYEPRIEAVKNIFNKARCPWFATRGNHDYNSDDYNPGNNENIKVFHDIAVADDFFISAHDWHKSITSQYTLPSHIKVVFDNEHPTKGYFYVDDYAQKHRMIYLNSHETIENEYGRIYINESSKLDYALSGAAATKHQILWLVNTAMDMTDKTDWVVSFYSHTAPYTDAGEEDISEFHGYGGDEPQLRTIIKAFQNGTSVNMKYSCANLDNVIPSWEGVQINKDFTNQGAISVIGWFSGHTHDDCYRQVDGLNIFISTCTCPDRRTDWSLDKTPTKLPPERNSSNLAMSMNVFIVNKDTHTVNVIKLGSKRDNTDITSSDYTFTYA